MRFEYDNEASAGYLTLQEGAVVDHTVEGTQEINLDFDSEGRLVGLEFLGSSQLPPALLAMPRGLSFAVVEGEPPEPEDPGAGRGGISW